ncbi:MAG TPA: tetratricopeptide repeat protein [Vicinamibacterales bacterium]|nr:tetratricopeptide repeat protein [Vicinamibacterales bacterium]
MGDDCRSSIGDRRSAIRDRRSTIGDRRRWTMADRRWTIAVVCFLLVFVTGCAPKVAPPVATAPKYPDYIFPTLAEPDARQAELLREHDAAWRWFQAGDLSRAEAGFAAILKRVPQFYPSEAALGYLELARKNFELAASRFERALQANPEYVPALVGRGETMLALSRESEALTSFETAVKMDPQLQTIARRVEVLRARAQQENVAAARQAVQANRLDEAARLYERAIAASPESAFLVRDLADVEAKQGKTDEALARYRRAIEMDPSDAASHIRVGEILDASGDLEGAHRMFTEANTLEPSPDLRRRLAAIDARLAYLKLPAEYRAIPEAASITRGDLAALIGLRLQPLLQRAPAQAILITDARNHWASEWIIATAQAGVMEAYENHTFQPLNIVRRSDLAQSVAHMLKIIAAGRPQLLKDWQGRMQKMSDVGVSNLQYADASLSVAAGIIPLVDGNAFQLSRPVSGAEAIEAITAVERLLTTSK